MPMPPLPPYCPICKRRFRMPAWMAKEFSDANRRTMVCDRCEKDRKAAR